MDIKDKIIKWLTTCNTGISSKAIVAQLTGNKITRGGIGDHPHDSGDFGRCVTLLEMVPEFKERIGEMATRSNEWFALVKHWNELTKLYATNGSCYQRIKEILNTVHDKKGIDLGNNITIYR